MCTRTASKVLVLVTLFMTPAMSLEKAPSARKLPSSLRAKEPLAYFSFDRKGRALSRNQIKTPQTIQLIGAHYTSEGLDKGALRCTGSAQIRVPLPATDELTFSAWFLPTDLARQNSFSACTLQSNQHTLTIRMHQDGTLRIQQTTPFSQGSSSMNAGLDFPAHQWVHLALAATPQQLTLFLNGQQVGVFNMPVPLSRARLMMAGQAYKGRIDEMALFKQTLSPQDIRSLFEMYRPSMVVETSERAIADTWEAKAAYSYGELTQAINSGNWSAAAAQATAVSGLVEGYLEDQKTLLAKPEQEPIKTNLDRASECLQAFHSAVERAKYREASDLFDRLDEVWETLEGQLNLPVSNNNTMASVPLAAPGMRQSGQFNQTWRSSSIAMPGGGFSSGMSMGGGFGGGNAGGGGFSMSSSSGRMSVGGFGGGNPGGGRGLSMSSSSGPNDQSSFRSAAGAPGLAFMGRLRDQMPPQMVQQQVLMQCQRIQMTLMPLKMSLQNGDWAMARAHARRIPPLLAPMTPPKRNTRSRRRALNLNSLPPAQQTALKKTVQVARNHIKRLDTALKEQQLEAATTQIESLETAIQGLSQWPNTAAQPKQPPETK